MPNGPLSFEPMKLHVHPDFDSLSTATAHLIAAYIRRKPASLVCLASGHSPLGVFRNLVDEVRAGRLDVTNVTWVSLDEWAGIPADNPGSCRYMMDEGLFKPLAIPEDKIRFFHAMNHAPQQEADQMNRFLEAHGGLDIMLVGIGLNGHIAMNEPGTSFDLHAHVTQLSEETIAVGQKYFQSPTLLDKGITLGLANLKESRLPILIANGEKKKAIVHEALTGAVTTQVPASMLQTLPHAYVFIDQACHTS